MLSDMLKKKGIKHQVLNAKKHLEEAMIVAQAGRLGAVTVATNMAGRGVDIVLGGAAEGRDKKEWQQEHDKVLVIGGIYILGTERHEARRIDNQLRGRAGRQGDPGFSRFYVSLEDNIVSRFGGDRIRGIMEWAGFDENTPIENKLINRSIESAQVRVEGYHFDIRKHLVEYDDVVNQQRELIYSERRKIISRTDLKSNILSMVDEEIKSIVAAHSGNGKYDEFDIDSILREAATIFSLSSELNTETLKSLKIEQVEKHLNDYAHTIYESREQKLGSEIIRSIERLVMLRTIDNLWREHLTNMEEKRLEAQWQTLRQVKSVDAYKGMGYEQFQSMLENFRTIVAHTIFRVNIVTKESQPRRPVTMIRTAAGTPPGNSNTLSTSVKQNQIPTGKKVGRNDPCPCGSGKKYKHCHGK